MKNKALSLITKTLLILAICLISAKGFSQVSEEDLNKYVSAHVSQTHHPDSSQLRTIYIGHGMVSIPATATSRRTGTRDSDMGEIVTDGFTVIYDVGMMSGGISYILKTHPDPELFHWYYETEVAGYKVYMALITPFDKTRLHITVWTKKPNATSDLDLGTPANFTAVVNTKSDVEKLLGIALSFRAKKLN